MNDDRTIEEQNEEKEAFKQAKVFTQKEEYWGIPSKIVYNVFALSIGLMVAFRSISGIVLGLIMLTLLIVPLYHIHKDDPFALVVWKRCMLRKHNRWCAGRAEKRKIKYLDREEI
jgi:hypothetical protein